MSPSFLVKIICYICRPVTITLVSSAFICAGRCPPQINAEDSERPTCATENFNEER